MAQESITVEVNMKTKYMFSFLFQHVHRSFPGIFGIVLSLGALGFFVASFFGTPDVTRQIILLVIGLLFTVVNPLMLLLKAKKQVALAPVFKQPLTYTFSMDGMTVAQGEEEQFIDWSHVIAIRKTASILIIYTSRNSGSILAYSELGDKKQAVESIICEGCKQAGMNRLPRSMKG